ncbi:MAG: hypothetical protein LN588_03075 [Rickettsia endosymbiont of Bryobia graminum]|nr:hypothetical protein [Rickettsia endosymbiont of Bryobia graminum]
MKILLLCNYQPHNASMVIDHINSFYLYSKHEVTICGCLVKNKGNFCHKDISFEDFDVILLHYSLFLTIDHYVSERTRIRLKNFTGIKGIFLQDEYNFVNKTVDLIAEIGFDIIFTCVPEESIEKVYPSSKLKEVERINVLTGYVPQSLLSYELTPLQERKFDVSYRGRKYPIWHGRLGLEKWQIADKFSDDAKRFNLKCNISYKEKDRLYGIEWVELLQNSIAVLGVESGASVFDFTGSISFQIDVYENLLKKDKSFFKRFLQNSKSVFTQEYNRIRNKYFAEIEDNIQYAQISPRVFEAIALKTLCILYEGKYSGILIPWRHFVPLKKDHSNMKEIVEFIKDPGRVAEIITNAYKEIALDPKYSYKNFISDIDLILERVYDKKKLGGCSHINDLQKFKSSNRKETNCFNMVYNPYAVLLPYTAKLVLLMPKQLKRIIQPFINIMKRKQKE